MFYKIKRHLSTLVPHALHCIQYNITPICVVVYTELHATPSSTTNHKTNTINCVQCRFCRDYIPPCHSPPPSPMCTTSIPYSSGFDRPSSPLCLALVHVWGRFYFVLFYIKISLSHMDCISDDEIYPNPRRCCTSSIALALPL